MFHFMYLASVPKKMKRGEAEFQQESEKQVWNSSPSTEWIDYSLLF